MKLNNHLKLWMLVVASAVLACGNSSAVIDQEDNSIISPSSTVSPGNNFTQPEPEEVRFEYTAGERRQIFYELVQAEDQAQEKVDLLFPTPDPLSDNYSSEQMSSAITGNVNYFKEIVESFQQEVAERYGLTLEELNEIGNEGLMYDWPMPSLE